jgi:histone H3/H4
MTDQEVSVNFSTAKKFLIGTGKHAAKDACIEMQQCINKYAANLAKEAAANTDLRRAKTIFVEDLRKAAGN